MMPTSLLSGLNQIGSLVDYRNQQSMLQNQMLQAQQRDSLRYLGLTALQQSSPKVSIGVEPVSLFYRLPSVMYLIEKIPAAQAVMKPDGVTATYLNEAKASGLSLKQQCKDLGIPWSSRLLSKSEVSLDAVKVAAILEPTVFAQAKPKENVGTWASRILTIHSSGAGKSVIDWAAWHVLEVGSDDIDYLGRQRDIVPSTSSKTIRERSAEWHRRIWLAPIGFASDHAPDAPAALPGCIDWSSMIFAGYEFRPLKTYADFAAEGSALRNCVSTRFPHAKRGDRVYFSMRTPKGENVATVEYEHGILSSAFHLREIKSISNAPPPPAAKLAAEKFQDVVSGKVKPQADQAPAKSAPAINTIPQKPEYDSKSWTG